MPKYVRPKDACELLRVDTTTLRRWDKTGKIKSIRTPGGSRRYDIESVAGFIQQNERYAVCYARVSSAKQHDDLTRQIEFLQHEHPGTCVISDIGSGINFNRPGFSRLMDEVTKERIQTVFITYRDRLARIGIELVTKIFRRFNVELVVHHDSSETPDKELTEDIISVITSFAGRMHGLRRYAVQMQEDESLADTTPGESSR